jgi:signal transduction histidine kinase
MEKIKEKQEFPKPLLRFKKLLGALIMKNSRMAIVIINTVFTVLTAFVFYPLLPLLLNYTPDFIKESSLLGPSYFTQYVIIFSFAIITGDIFLFWLLRGIDKWEKLLNTDEEHSVELNRIRRKCLNMPYIIYIAQILFFAGSVGLIFAIITILNGTSLIIVVKVFIIVLTLFSLTSVFSFIFSKRIYTGILLKTYKENTLEGLRIKLSSKIFLQVLPMFIVALLFTSLLGYSRIIEDRGDFVFRFYQNEMMSKFSKIDKVKDINQLKDILKDIGIKETELVHFIITPDKKIYTLNGEVLENIFVVNLENFADSRKGRVYGESGETEGTIIKLKGNDGEWVVGVKYRIPSSNVYNFFIVGFLALLSLNIVVLYFFSRNLSGEISLVAQNLGEIADGEHVDLDKKLAVTSNDEIGDLVVAFNKIQEREIEHINEIEEKQAILMEQERLASLGQLIGGIAHNLRTPIMSIAGGIEGLRDLIKEYEDSVEDENVTKNDHHDIAKEMVVWLDKMKPYCSYMSDIITAVKGQTVQPSELKGLSFVLGEVKQRVEILLEHELRRKHCRLNIEIKADMETKIKGEISILVQVLNNLIVNSVDSYDGQGGDVDFIVTKSEKIVQFIIKDYGKGIPKEIQEKLFKEMVTTKPKKGTGLGLYMSYSNIKARFGGKMRFESVEGKGTTFYIYLPC